MKYYIYFFVSLLEIKLSTTNIYLKESVSFQSNVGHSWGVPHLCLTHWWRFIGLTSSDTEELICVFHRAPLQGALLCAASHSFQWKSVVTVCKNSVGAGQGRHVTGTCLNNSPLLAHQHIGFCLFLTPFKTASFPRCPRGFAELRWIICWAGEGRQAGKQ